jgi:hypothetical protein
VHPAIPRPDVATPAPSRGAQHRAPGRAMPARRAPKAVELTDSDSAAVLSNLLAGLQAVPEKPVVDARTRQRDVLRALWNRLDLAGFALVAKAGAAASVVLTLVVLLWLASAGRLG